MLHVFDNVLAPSTSRYLHAASSLGELGDELHTTFDRSKPPTTALEQCLQSVLCALKDDSTWCEYWWRDSWEHVEAHEDVDEYLFESSGKRRHPTNAHVLYLTVGPAVRGPTCVWSCAEEPPLHGRVDFGALTTVPALSGRLLRFDGELMHAVPRPSLRWLPTTARASGRAASKASNKPTKDDLVRSVVLFNTWSEPPLDVPAADGAADPEAVIRELAASFSSPKIDALVEVMAEPDTECRPFDDWVEAEVSQRAAHDTQGDDNLQTMKVSLLGEANRRGQDDKTLEMPAPDGLADALTAEAAVTSFK